MRAPRARAGEYAKLRAKNAKKFFKSILTAGGWCGKIKERRDAFLSERVSGRDDENEDREVTV